MLKTLLTSAAALLCCSHLNATVPNDTPHADSVFIFTFVENNSLRMAYSYDMRSWQSVGNNRGFVNSDFGAWGSGKKMLSHSAVCDADRWYVVWSLNNRVNQFATTQTPNFWNWKPQDYPYMSLSENVANPILSKENGKFVVRYSTPSGKFMKTESADFKAWTNATAITEGEYQTSSKSTTIRLNGQARQGEIHRATYDFVQSLEAKSALADRKNASYNENTGQDAQRFRGLTAIQATLRIRPEDSKQISDKLIGIFFEDINYSADGGLYAELIQNRDFEYNADDRREWNSQSFWRLDGDGTTWTVSQTAPIHANNAHYVTLSTTQPGAAIINSGFDGIPVRKNERYDLSLLMRSDDGRKHSVRISLKEAGKTLASTILSTSSSTWKQLQQTLRPSAGATQAELYIEPLEAGDISIDFVSLFPQNTFKGRKNGLRADLAQALADLHPRFIRFPGGCLTHGNGIDNMYRWRETIGPLWERKPQFNIWGYHQTKGLGFFEYFQFCEDIGAEPLPVLPAGVPCQNSSKGGDGQQGGLQGEALVSYTHELLDLIEWANGDPKTSPLARMRAEAGHPEPFNLKMIGVGNEDLISDVFTERFLYIKNQIKARYPHIEVVGTVGPFFEGSDYEEGWRLARRENLDIVDEHYYVNPGWYIHNQDYYDKYDRKGTRVYLGEWASRGNRLENALAEAIHVTNLERNADLVTMSSYAPLLAKNGHTQWNPDLIYFNNSEVYPTANYQVQRLCGQNAGSKYIYADLEVSVLRDDNGTEVTAYNADAEKRISQSVVVDEKTGDLIIKLVNLTSLKATFHIELPTASSYAANAQVSVLTGSPAERDQKPTTETLAISPTTQYAAPAYSFSVIRLKHLRKK